MILSCPNCATSYTIDEAQLGPAGRTVRCAACKSTWHAQKPEEPIDLAVATPEPKPERAADLQNVKAKKVPLKYREMVEDKKRNKALLAQGLVWGALAACIMAIFAVAYVLRVDIIKAFPRIAGAYAMVGLKTNATNLEIFPRSADAAFRAGRFVVTVQTQIHNLSDRPTVVPPMKVKLLDATLQQFDTEVIASDGLVIAPHATRLLAFDVPDPKNMTAHIDVDFDLLDMKRMGAHPARATTTTQQVVADASEDTATPDPVQTQTLSGKAAPALRGMPPASISADTTTASDAPSDMDVTPSPVKTPATKPVAAAKTAAIKSGIS